MTECIFCKIVRGEMPCHKIYEDADYLAFLSIFPNTAGFSVVIPKQHYSSYAFDLPDDVLAGLVLASKRVGKLIDSKLPDVGRTGMIFEGPQVVGEINAGLERYLKKDGFATIHDAIGADHKTSV